MVEARGNFPAGLENRVNNFGSSVQHDAGSLQINGNGHPLQNGYSVQNGCIVQNGHPIQISHSIQHGHLNQNGQPLQQISFNAAQQQHIHHAPQHSHGFKLNGHHFTSNGSTVPNGHHHGIQVLDTEFSNTSGHLARNSIGIPFGNRVEGGTIDNVDNVAHLTKRTEQMFPRYLPNQTRSSENMPGYLTNGQLRTGFGETANSSSNGVTDKTFIEKLNHCLNSYDLNHIHNTNHDRFIQDGGGVNPNNTSIDRNSSDNSSMSSKNSRACLQSENQQMFNQENNQNPIVNNVTTSNVQPQLNGILRNSQSPFDSRNTSNNNSTRTNSSNPEREKVVRIDPTSYHSDEGPVKKPDSGKSVTGLRGILSSKNLNKNASQGALNKSKENVNGTTSDKDDILKAEKEKGEELRKAAGRGDLGKIQTLLGKPGNPASVALVNQLDEAGSSSLLRAACEGRVGAIKLLLKHGANVDHQDHQHGNTALHEAAWKGYSESCVLLVKARADLHLKNKGGFAALHLSCQNGHNESSRVLLYAGANSDIKNNYGDSPLHTAARYGHAGVTRILLSAKCDVNSVNKNGDSSLHIAAAMGRRKLTRILLEAGGEQHCYNKQKETPQDIAARKDFAQILDILKNPPPVITAEERLKREKRDESREKKRDVSREKGEKKREKNNDSATSSKDSSSRKKEKKKMKSDHKDKKGHCKDGIHWSPYGCHNYSPAVNIPSTNVDLPKDNLKSGEQFFIDLAGNVKKGPVGVNTSCYCAPFFKKVETKLESDKVALMDHIDAHHEKLDKRIHSLERKTHTHIHDLKETVQQKIAREKEECLHRNSESVKEKESLVHKHNENLRQWVEQRLAAHDPAVPPIIKKKNDSTISRSRSEEALTEITVENHEVVSNGLRVLDHPTTSMYNLNQKEDDDVQMTEGPMRMTGSHKMELMEDSSDSEGEDEEQQNSTASFYQKYEPQDRQPFYANTGAIPKGSASSLPNSSSATNNKDSSFSEQVSGLQRWPIHNKYDPRNNKHFLYDVQEIEATYGNHKTVSEPDGRAKDSGCSEGSSQTEIAEVEEDSNTSSDHQSQFQSRVLQPLAPNNYPSHQHPHSVNGIQLPTSMVKTQQDSIQYPPPQTVYSVDGHSVDGPNENVATYLDMDRYRIQQAVKRLYDGYVTEQKVELGGTSSGSGTSSGCSVGEITSSAGSSSEGRSRSTLHESSLDHDSHNDSGYSTRLCSGSQGPSPALSANSCVLDGSGSESRSGQSTTSTNNTVIGFPQQLGRKPSELPGGGRTVPTPPVQYLRTSQSSNPIQSKSLHKQIQRNSLTHANCIQHPPSYEVTRQQQLLQRQSISANNNVLPKYPYYNNTKSSETNQCQPINKFDSQNLNRSSYSQQYRVGIPPQQGNGSQVLDILTLGESSLV